MFMLNINWKYSFCIVYLVMSINVFSQTDLITIKCQSFDKEVTVDSDFLNKINLIDDFSSKNYIRILVQQSFRIVGQKIDNAIVYPILRSNHYLISAMLQPFGARFLAERKSGYMQPVSS
jgi:hypothetical protein